MFNTFFYRLKENKGNSWDAHLRPGNTGGEAGIPGSDPTLTKRFNENRDEEKVRKKGKRLEARYL